MKNKNDKKTLDEVKLDFYNWTNGEYEILSTEYVSNKSPLSVKHCKCGNVYEVKYTDFKRGQRCGRKECIKERQKNAHFGKALTEDEIKNRLSETTNGEYTFISKERVNNRTYLNLKHERCGEPVRVRMDIFFTTGVRCKKCRVEDFSKEYRFTHEEFLAKLEEKHKGIYEVLTEYVDYSETPVTVYKKKCGHTFESVPNYLLYKPNSYCPVCSKSMEERFIADFLKENHIDYDTEVYYDECKIVKPLKFDFCIYSDREKDKYILLEYDGGLHFTSVEKFNEFHNKDRLTEYNYHDTVKNEFCETYSIKLYRIREISKSPNKNLENIKNELTAILKENGIL